MTHICVSGLTIIGSDNGLSPGRRQAIIRTNSGILLIRPLGTNFSEILIDILIFSFKKMRLKVSSAKRRPFCLGLNVLIPWIPNTDFLFDHCAFIFMKNGWQDLTLHGLVLHTMRHFIVRRAGLLWSQQDFEWLWSVPLSSASLY